MTELIETENTPFETQEQIDAKIDFLSPVYKIGNIIEQAGGINDIFFEFANPHLDIIISNLQITKMESVLYAALLNLYNGYVITIREFSNYLHCKPFEILHYMDELEHLERKEFIHIKREPEDFRFSSSRIALSFELRFATIEAIRKGKYLDVMITKNLSIEKFFVQLERLFEERIQRRQTYQSAIKK